MLGLRILGLWGHLHRRRCAAGRRHLQRPGLASRQATTLLQQATHRLFYSKATLWHANTAHELPGLARGSRAAAAARPLDLDGPARGSWSAVGAFLS
jgi:hypothetical protein